MNINNNNDERSKYTFTFFTSSKQNLADEAKTLEQKINPSLTDQQLVEERQRNLNSTTNKDLTFHMQTSSEVLKEEKFLLNFIQKYAFRIIHISEPQTTCLVQLFFMLREIEKLQDKIFSVQVTKQLRQKLQMKHCTKYEIITTKPIDVASRVNLLQKRFFLKFGFTAMEDTADLENGNLTSFMSKVKTEKDWLKIARIITFSIMFLILKHALLTESGLYLKSNLDLATVRLALENANSINMFLTTCQNVLIPMVPEVYHMIPKHDLDKVFSILQNMYSNMRTESNKTFNKLTEEEVEKMLMQCLAEHSQFPTE